MYRKTKIICTIGPSSSGTANLTKLVESGMDVARLNFSHGSHEIHRQSIEDIRSVSQATGKPIAIILDLQGPKIRTGKVLGDRVQLSDGSRFTITTDHLELGNAERVSTSYANLIHDVSPGSTILIDDGYIILTVEELSDNDIHTRVVKGGVLSNHKGIIAPGVKITAPSLSEKDIEDIKFGLANGVDAIALSFVRSERDVLELKTTMKLFGRSVPVIAKIERYEAIDDIEDIIAEADAIMIARGDLGLEMQAEDVPVLQKHIITRCNFFGKPVITATQMLESMIENPRPTRAEASDVANAVIDGTDCVMLSAETSVGDYPVQSVEYMDRIIRKAEEHFRANQRAYDIPKESQHNVADAIGRACCVIAEQVEAAAIVPLTSSGGTARIIAKYRPATPILALTDHEETQRQLTFVWGVYPKLIPPLVETDSLLTTIADIVLATGFAKRGDHVVYSAGTPLNKRVSTNMLKVERL